MTQPNTGKYFPIYFSLHYQTLKNNSLLKKNYFPASKRDLNKSIHFSARQISTTLHH
jgi:hypothetical protein